MKSQRLYDEYSIETWPCHFMYMESVDEYNGWLKKKCEKLPEGRRDLPVLMRISRKLMIIKLDIKEVIRGNRETKAVKEKTRR